MCDKFSESVTKILSVIEERSPTTASIPLIKAATPPRPFTVLVEGNIGSGKSTYLKHFSKLSKDVDIITEPVDKWRDLNSHNLLQMMYEDPQRQVKLYYNNFRCVVCRSRTFPCISCPPCINKVKKNL